MTEPTTTPCDAHFAGNRGPNALQRDFIARGYGMFIHFGINTFNETEWSYGKLPVETYHPTALDCDQWIRVAKEAGFRHVVLTTKHLDGFCLWPTRLTDYNVAASPVKTDVVAEVAQACRNHGVQLGLYYSLWDAHEPSQSNDMPRYVEFMKGQITELLTGYGPVCEFWFDAPWATPSDSDWSYPEVRELIRRLQPDCAVTVNHTVSLPEDPRKPCLPEDYVHGSRLRFWPVDFRAKDPNLVRADDPKIYTTPDGREAYLPFEHTVCISALANWFQKAEVRPARTADELEALFYWCTANDNVLLLNIPPDQTGRLRENEIQAALEAADLLGIRGGNTPLPAAPVNQALAAQAGADSASDPAHGADKAVDGRLESTQWAAASTPATLTLSPLQPFCFNRIVLHESFTVRELGDIFSQEREFAIRRFVIDAWVQGEWQPIHEGTEIGAARTIRFRNLLTTDRLRVRILESLRPAGLRHIEISDHSVRRNRTSGIT
jgi:alpha-L-fucosidase